MAHYTILAIGSLITAIAVFFAAFFIARADYSGGKRRERRTEYELKKSDYYFNFINAIFIVLNIAGFYFYLIDRDQNDLRRQESEAERAYGLSVALITDLGCRDEPVAGVTASPRDKALLCDQVRPINQSPYLLNDLSRLDLNKNLRLDEPGAQGLWNTFVGREDDLRKIRNQIQRYGTTTVYREIYVKWLFLAPAIFAVLQAVRTARVGAEAAWKKAKPAVPQPQAPPPQDNPRT